MMIADAAGSTGSDGTMLGFADPGLHIRHCTAIHLLPGCYSHLGIESTPVLKVVYADPASRTDIY
jgi:hypothetical protein